MSLRILQPGIQTTLQDLGRWGNQHLGVPVSGAMDEFASAMANLLVGNDEHAACLEFVMSNASFTVEDDCLMAFCGKGTEVWAQGENIPLWRSCLVKAGTEIKMRPVSRGYRTYLSVAGGFQVLPVMNSRSTYEPAQLGGLAGRALQQNDKLVVEPTASAISFHMIDTLARENRNLAVSHWTVDFKTPPDYSREFIRMVKGPEWDWFTDEAQGRFFGSGFTLSVQSNRMGFRMLGKPLSFKNQTELISTAVCKGTLQVTNDGSLVMLMSDCQTTGGYPRIAQTAAVDLAVCAQLRPNDTVAFTEISGTDAERLYLERELELRQVKQNIELIFS